MIGRLGELGDNSTDRNRTFKELLSQSSVSQWGLGNIGNRFAIARKLLGRISAYLRIYSKDQEGEKQMNLSSSTFVVWLSEECQKNNQNQSIKSRRKKSNSNQMTQTLTIGTLLHNVHETISSYQDARPDDIELNEVDENFDEPKEIVASFPNSDRKSLEIREDIVNTNEEFNSSLNQFLTDDNNVSDFAVKC